MTGGTFRQFGQWRIERVVVAILAFAVAFLAVVPGCNGGPERAPANGDGAIDDEGDRESDPDGNSNVAPGDSGESGDEPPARYAADALTDFQSRVAAFAATAQAALQHRNVTAPFRAAVAVTGTWPAPASRLEIAALTADALRKDLPDVVHPSVSLAWFDRADGALTSAAAGSPGGVCQLARQLGADLLLVVSPKPATGAAGVLSATLSGWLTADHAPVGEPLPPESVAEPPADITDVAALTRVAGAPGVQLDIALLVRRSFVDLPQPLARGDTLPAGSYIRVWVRVAGTTTAGVWLITERGTWPLLPTDTPPSALPEATVLVAPEHAWLELGDAGEFAIVAHAAARIRQVLPADSLDAVAGMWPGAGSWFERVRDPLLPTRSPGPAASAAAWIADRTRRMRDAVLQANICAAVHNSHPWSAADANDRMLSVTPESRFEWRPRPPHVQLVDGAGEVTPAGRFPAPDRLDMWFGRERLLLPEPLGTDEFLEPDDSGTSETDRTPAARQKVVFDSTAAPGAATFVRRFRILPPPTRADADADDQ